MKEARAVAGAGRVEEVHQAVVDPGLAKQLAQLSRRLQAAVLPQSQEEDAVEDVMRFLKALSEL